MYDSFYNIWEQQQKIANIYNQIYTPELLKMQQTYSDIITQMQPAIDVVQNITGLSTLAEQAMMIRNFDTDKFLNAYNRTMEVDRRLTQSMAGVLENMNIDRYLSLVRQVTLPTEAFQNIHNLHLNLFTGYGEIIDRISSLSENEIEFILEGTDFTAEEVLEDIHELKEEFSVSKQDVLGNDSIILKNKWDNFLKNHPALENIIFIMGVIIGLVSGIFGINDIGELVISATQEVIVKMQGKEDIFFVKVDSAKLYTEPNSHSKVITKILYAEEITRIDSVKMWDKVTYINPDGEEIIGWIAKKNRISYKDYEFNSDDL